jgi:hypothetical protein
MTQSQGKQLVLKPQDLLLALKIAVNAEREFLLTDLSSELSIAVSLIHGSVLRAEQARLLSRATGSIRVSPSALKEFVIHGAKYCFPGQLGALSRGLPTAVGGPVLAPLFEASGSLPPVWPDPEGDSWGPSLAPLHPSVSVAVKRDAKLYEVLSLLDALRVGAARERELALTHLDALL